MFPKAPRFALEIGNRNWLNARFADALREHNLALVLTDHSWMPRPTELFDTFDPITSSFVYVRWMGDRRGTSAESNSWDRVTVDRTREIARVGGSFQEDHRSPRYNFRVCRQPLRGARASHRGDVQENVAASATIRERLTLCPHEWCALPIGVASCKTVDRILSSRQYHREIPVS